jgi:hypothetical protein
MASTSSSQRPLLPSSGRELLLDLKRSVQTAGDRGGSSATMTSSQHKVPVLPTYNSKLVQACFQDLHNSVQELSLAIHALDRSNYANEEDDNSTGGGGGAGKAKSSFSMSSRPVILMHSESIERYKRCLLAYHYQRMEIIKEIQRLNNTDASASSTGDDGAIAATADVSANKHEVDFARTYAQLRNSYSTNVFELNMPPPTSHMVQVRVLQDIGQVVLPESGRSVNLMKGACLFLERVDVQDFLRDGIVQIYDGEEVDF